MNKLLYVLIISTLITGCQIQQELTPIDCILQTENIRCEVSESETPTEFTIILFTSRATPENPGLAIQKVSATDQECTYVRQSSSGTSTTYTCPIQETTNQQFLLHVTNYVDEYTVQGIVLFQ